MLRINNLRPRYYLHEMLIAGDKISTNKLLSETFAHVAEKLKYDLSITNLV